MREYVIVDLEMCKVPKPMRTEKYHWSLETIQIGAVLVNENLEIIDEFNSYVHPEYGSIDDYIKHLTGITPFDVRDANGMEDALKAFVNWVPEDAVCVSWSTSDEKQIRHEIEAKEIHLPRLEMLLDNWQDCQKTFGEKMNTERQYRLSEALIAADILYDENIHNGLVDARNTAELFIKMEKEPVLVLNNYYRRSLEEEVQPEMYTIGDLFPGLQMAIA